MNALHQTSAALAASVLLAAAAALGGMPAARADIPRSVHDASHGRAGELDAGWVRVACATSSDAVKCAIRVPAGYSRLDLDIRQAGASIVDLSTWTDERRTWGKPRRATGRVVPGVLVACEGHGNRLACDLDLAWRIDAFNVSWYSAGQDWGGQVGSDWK